MMLDRPVQPIATPQEELNEIHSNLYTVLDAAIQTINEMTETIEALDERVQALENPESESSDAEI